MARQLIKLAFGTFAYQASIWIVLVCTSRGSVYSDDIKNCSTALKDFASKTGGFIHCAIVYARPIRMCESCVHNYTHVLEAYDTILELKDESGKLCKEILINVDRLEIIQNGFMYVQSLWQNGHCSSCFEVINGSLSDQLNNNTVAFRSLYNQTRDCIASHYVNSSGTYNISVCSDCANIYMKMNALYEEMKDSHGEGNVCIDIVDSVNATRTKWSGILYCGRKEMILEVPLVVVIVVVSLTPVVFYMMTRKLSIQVETRLSQQKRLVETQNISVGSSASTSHAAAH